MANSPQPDNPADSRSLEEIKFEFNRDLENRKLALEERKLQQARMEAWTKFWAAVLLTGFVTGAFNLFAQQRAEKAAKVEMATAERAQQAKVAIELVNAREKAATDLRAQMFSALLENYFDKASRREQIVILSIMALNFRDAIQIRPMLELLDAQILETPRSEERTRLRTELRRAARVVIKDQLEQIRESRDGEVSSKEISVGELVTVSCGPNVAFRLETVLDDSTILIQPAGHDGSISEKAFTLTYFDMPMLDYKTVRSGGSNLWRYSVVLQNVAADQKSAEIGIACLPQSPLGAERRYAFDELLDEYLHSTETAPQ